MGIEEMVLERARKKGLKEGLQEGLKEGLKLGLRQAGEKNNYEFVKNLLLETNFSVTKISALANVAEAFVLEVKKTCTNVLKFVQILPS